MPLYRHNGKIIFFIHVPKTGGSSVEKAFRELGCKQALYSKERRAFFKTTLQHMNSGVYKTVMDDDFYDYAFMVVRNPFDRAASEFKMKVTDAGGTETFDHWFSNAIARYKEYPFTRDNHIRPQYKFHVPGVEVFRLEDGVDRAIRAGCAVLEIDAPAETPHQRKGSSGPISASLKTLKMIEKLYAKDFELFGYDRDYSRSFVITP